MQGPCPTRRNGGRGPRLARLLAGPLRGVAALAALAACTPAAAGGLSLPPEMPWLFAAAVLLSAGAAGYAIGALRERRRADAALRAAREEQRSLAALSDGWAWQTDADHLLQRLQPPAGAPAAEWSRSAGAGVALWQRFDSAVPGDTAGLRARLQSHAAFGALPVRQVGDGSGWLLRGAPRFDGLGRFAGYDGSARPTAEQDALHADRAALHALLAALPAPVLLAQRDGPAAGWVLQHANPPAAELLGSAAQQWADVLARLPAPLREAAEGAAQADAGQHAGWLLHRFSSPGLEGGAARAGLLLLRATPAAADTQGTADAAETADADADAASSDSASFSFTISHDLRAPIRVVEGFTRILKEDYGRQLDRVGNDHLDRVLAAAARMNHMIDALLTVARLSQQPLARQPVNLSQLAGYVVDDLRRAAPERVAEIEIEPGLLTQGDPTLLRQVLENLLGNAWKYTARCKKANIVFGSTQHEGRRAYVVRDNGAGFDMRSADRLFGLFQRLHSANDFPGTGVGLASVKRIVRRHGGSVWADAEPGRGAAFHFTLRD